MHVQNGKTALSYALEGGHEAIVLALLAAGADATEGSDVRVMTGTTVIAVDFNHFIF